MIFNFVKKHFWRFMVFSIIGFAAFLIDWLFFNIFYSITSWFILSMTLATAISMIFNFIVNRNLTFKARGHSIKKQMPRWILIYILAFLARVISGKIILNLLGENTLTANIAFLVGISLAIPISFLGSLLWAFKKEDELIIPV